MLILFIVHFVKRLRERPLFLWLGKHAQTLRGVVTDAISGEALIGATVKLVEADKGAVTDIDGNYRIESWKNVIFVPLSTWKSVRKQTYSHWKSVFYLLFMLVFK